MITCPKIPFAVRVVGAIGAVMVTTSIMSGVDQFAPVPFSAILSIVQLDRVVVTGGVQLQRVVVTGRRS
ncbi:MAG: hypothetical protein IV092_11495 [Burkholderiaceae bacterium]|nr:hypothetical protein [Burkholderiaceae bacterium]MBT9501863.1 hypothetical protein [Burkholderiaceae bacterium]